MNSPFHPSRKTTGGFTLVEILVAVAVLGLMMVGVAQMMNSALSATLGGYKHMDADTQARMVLDRMAFDISRITKRGDVDYFFQKNTGNDQMAFYSESGGYYPSGTTATQDSEVSLVGYMINGNNQLVRLSKGLNWNGVNSGYPAMVFNPSPSSITSNTITSTWSQISTGTDSNYQVIGDQVFRLEYCFLVQTAPVPTSNAASQQSTVPYFSDSPWQPTNSTPNALKDVTAVIVSIAVLDNKTRALVSSSQLQTAATDLSDDGFATATKTNLTTTTASLPLPLWKTALGTGLGLPNAASSQVRFYQRYCYLNHLQ